MNRLAPLVAAASLAVGGVSFLGCQSDNGSHPSQTETKGQTGGGNGSFGESPTKSGNNNNGLNGTSGSGGSDSNTTGSSGSNSGK